MKTEGKKQSVVRDRLHKSLPGPVIFLSLSYSSLTTDQSGKHSLTHSLSFTHSHSVAPRNGQSRGKKGVKEIERDNGGVIVLGRKDGESLFCPILHSLYCGNCE